MIKKNKTRSAFSLIELSMILIIVSILLFSSMSVSKRVLHNSKTKITNDRISEIYRALGNFLITNGRLPCPAAINLNKSNSSYGTAAATCDAAPSSASGFWKSTSNSNLYYGMIPTQTLGLLPELSEDGFGTKFSYVVINGFTSSAKFNTQTSGLNGTYANSSGTEKIFVKERTSSDSTITSDAIFVITSYGANKRGGWNANSTAQNAASSDAQESQNDVSATDTTTGTAAFDNIIFASSSNSDDFDDIIFYKTQAQLLGDFNYFSTPSCFENVSQTIAYGSNNVTHAWVGSNSVAEGDIVASSTLCPSGYTAGVAAPTKRCGAFKRWDSNVTTSCTAN